MIQEQWLQLNSQFEFLVITKKNIFIYGLFFVSRYFRFYYTFYVKTATPWKKSPASFPATPLWTEILSSPLFWKFGWRLTTPFSRNGGAHYGGIHLGNFSSWVDEHIFGRWNRAAPSLAVRKILLVEGTFWPNSKTSCK